MSYLTQMLLGLIVQNFLLAGSGMALIRGFVRRNSDSRQLLGRYDPRHLVHPVAVGLGRSGRDVAGVAQVEGHFGVVGGLHS